MADPATEAFLAHRNLLFTVAYQMLGSAADAEDVLQETWLRWVDVHLADVRDQRAYLVRITTRQALMRLRTLGRRKESYVGPWLPEPLLTAPDVAEDVELADSVSMAMLLVLETLTPAERAVFVLRDVFDLAYDEIAEAVGAGEVARLLTAGLGNLATGSLRPAQVNGYPALILRRDGEVDTVVAVRVEDGLITGLYAVRNPEKLSRLDAETALRR
jgi:RNA polymerase sigma factor (sigma-70 family)